MLATAVRTRTRTARHSKASHHTANFESDNLVGGNQLTGRAGVEIGRRWIVDYQVQRQANEDTEFGSGGTTHGPVVGWNPAPRGAWKASFSLGLAFIQPIGGTTTSPKPVGGTSLSYRFHRHRLSAGFSRGVGLAYGLGVTTISNYVTLADTYTLSPKITLAVALSGGLATQPPSQDEAFRNMGGSFNLGWSVSPSLGVSAGYVLYAYRRAESEQMINHSLSISISYQQAWR